MAFADCMAQPAWAAGTDDESFSLILSLMQEDAMAFASNSKGKQRAGQQTDAELAAQLYAEELERASTMLSDRRMMRSMQCAVQSDRDALLEAQQLEILANNDREMALRLARGLPPTNNRMPTNNNAGSSAADMETMERLEAMYVVISDDEDDVSIQPESSAWAAARSKASAPPRRVCEACSDNKRVAELSRCPCGHEYCRTCLQHLFRSAIADESLFPPRCCRQPIPVEDKILFVGSDLIQQFRTKSVEYSTPNRTYCSRASCSAFIPPQRIIGVVASCPSCGDRTCTTCKREAHQGDCPYDRELHRVLQVARQEGWQRCNNCSTMVELNTGCFHMTCKCKYEFCYLCGAHWKSCSCVQWEEERLLERAQRIYARHVEEDDDDDDDEDYDMADRDDDLAQAVRHEARDEGIGRIMNFLRENHECAHESWRHRKGSFDCENCGDEMPVYINECRQCNLMLCRRCRFNRL